MQLDNEEENENYEKKTMQKQKQLNIKHITKDKMKLVD